MSSHLEQDFHHAMQSIYDRAAKLKPPYYAKAFRQLVNTHGGKAAADRLLAAAKPSQNFVELFLRGRENLQLSAEYLVLQAPWSSLFSAEQLAIARRRLIQHECPLPPQPAASDEPGATQA